MKPMLLLNPAEFTTVHSTSVLECETSTGGKKYWQGHVAHDADKNYYTYTTYCQSVGGNEVEPDDELDWEALQGESVSKITVSAPTLIEAKNVGRANETTPKDQALFEINSTWKKQKDKGYYELGQGESAGDALLLPMLAKQFADYGHKIDWDKGVTVQPKYDGVRCVSDGTKMWSRKGKLFIDKIVAHLLGGAQASSAKADKPKAPRQVTLGMLENELPTTTPPEDGIHRIGGLNTLGYIVDGELILPPPFPLQDTVSAAKKFYPEMSPKLLYRIYDVVEPKLPYHERYEIVKKIVAASNHPQIVAAPVHVVYDEEDIYPLHEQFVKEGWEGTMIRNHVDGYKARHRSSSLLKMKDFLEEEFEVVGIEEGKGKFVGAAIFVCVTDKGKRFNTTPVGTMEQRQWYFQNPDKVIGTRWTVRFQAWTKEEVPQFGRAINQRDEDVQG